MAINQLKAGAALSYVIIGLNSVVGLVYTPFMLRRLGQSEYGLYALAASVIAYLTVLDLNRPQAVDSSTFLSMGRATPFDGWTVTAGVDKTICNGNLVYTAASRNVNKTPIPPCQEDYV